MNPGGVDRSVTWTDLEEQQGDWQRLFDWRLEPARVPQRPVSGRAAPIRQRIENAAREAIAESIFSGGRRDFEVAETRRRDVRSAVSCRRTTVMRRRPKAASGCSESGGGSRPIGPPTTTPGCRNTRVTTSRPSPVYMAGYRMIFEQDVTDLAHDAASVRPRNPRLRSAICAPPGRNLFPVPPVLAGSICTKAGESAPAAKNASRPTAPDRRTMMCATGWTTTAGSRLERARSSG